MQHSDEFPHLAGGRGRFDRMNRIDRMPTRCPRSGIYPVDPVHPVQSSDPGGRQRSRTSGVLRASVVNFRPLPTFGMHTQSSNPKRQRGLERSEVSTRQPPRPRLTTSCSPLPLGEGPGIARQRPALERTSDENRALTSSAYPKTSEVFGDFGSLSRSRIGSHVERHRPAFWRTQPRKRALDSNPSLPPR